MDDITGMTKAGLIQCDHELNIRAVEDLVYHLSSTVSRVVISDDAGHGNSSRPLPVISTIRVINSYLVTVNSIMISTSVLSVCWYSAILAIFQSTVCKFQLQTRGYYIFVVLLC